MSPDETTKKRTGTSLDNFTLICWSFFETATSVVPSYEGRLFSGVPGLKPDDSRIADLVTSSFLHHLIQYVSLTAKAI